MGSEMCIRDRFRGARIGKQQADLPVFSDLLLKADSVPGEDFVAALLAGRVDELRDILARAFLATSPALASWLRTYGCPQVPPQRPWRCWNGTK